VARDYWRTGAAEVDDLCRKQAIPFLFKQASNEYTERREVDPSTVALIRQYPETDLPFGEATVSCHTLEVGQYFFWYILYRFQ
jgi:hypothetical protein